MQPHDTCTDFPAETQALLARGDRIGTWWTQAIGEWRRTHARGRRSRWLPSGFDPFAVCRAVGPDGQPCGDCWCSAPDVYAPGHDRRRRETVLDRDVSREQSTPAEVVGEVRQSA